MRSERSEAISPAGICGSVPGKGNSKSKGQGAGVYLTCLRSRRTSGVRRDGEGIDEVKGQGEQAIVKTFLLNELGKHCEF